MFDRSFLSYLVLVQVGGVQSTNRTGFLIAIPIESMSRFEALSENQHLY